MDELAGQGAFTTLLTLHAATYGLVKVWMKQEKIPLKLEQLPVVMCIYEYGTLCQQEIADAVFRDKSSVQRTISKLECLGFVETRNNMDKRKKSLVLSDAGIAIAERITTLMSGQACSVRELNDRFEARLRQICNNIAYAKD